MTREMSVAKNGFAGLIVITLATWLIVVQIVRKNGPIKSQEALEEDNKMLQLISISSVYKNYSIPKNNNQIDLKIPKNVRTDTSGAKSVYDIYDFSSTGRIERWTGDVSINLFSLFHKNLESIIWVNSSQLDGIILGASNASNSENHKNMVKEFMLHKERQYSKIATQVKKICSKLLHHNGTKLHDSFRSTICTGGKLHRLSILLVLK